MLFIDVSKAYLHADVEDADLYGEFPKEVRLHEEGAPRHARSCIVLGKEHTKALIEMVSSKVSQVHACSVILIWKCVRLLTATIL